MEKTTERLLIKHYKKENLKDFKTVLMDDDIMKHISGKGYSLEVTEQKFANALEVNSKNKNAGFFNVTLKENSRLVGFAKLVAIDDDKLEVGYAIVKNLWGKGFASEITLNLVEHARIYYPEKAVIGIVDFGNEASKNVLLKQNFKFYKTDNFNGKKVEYYKLPH